MNESFKKGFLTKVATVKVAAPLTAISTGPKALAKTFSPQISGQMRQGIQSAASAVNASQGMRNVAGSVKP